MVEVNLCKYSFAKVKSMTFGEAGFNLVDGNPQFTYTAVEFGPSGSLRNADKSLTSNGKVDTHNLAEQCPSEVVRLHVDSTWVTITACQSPVLFAASI